MKDKNGKEIQHGDFLRIKFKMYDEKCQYDGIYKVLLNGWEGATLRLVEIFEPTETYHTSLTWKRDDLTFDYMNHKDNPNYSQYLAIDNKYETVGLYDKRVQVRYYSNDIEIIENYEEKIPQNIA
jgi:hypothetical protein